MARQPGWAGTGGVFGNIQFGSNADAQVIAGLSRQQNDDLIREFGFEQEKILQLDNLYREKL